jgi:hypothetical protein
VQENLWVALLGYECGDHVHEMVLKGLQEGRLDAQPVLFRCRIPGGQACPIRADFGDGTQLEDFAAGGEVAHFVTQPGIHVITATCQVGGMPVTQMQNVVVSLPKRS